MTADLRPDQIRQAIEESARVITSLKEIAPELNRAAAVVGDCLHGGGRLLVLGNGGSAAQAQHLAAELVGRLVAEHRPLPAIALTTDTSILTAVANDYGFEEIFSRQLRALGWPGDIVLALSTSGHSPNVLRALETAREMNLKTIGLTGRTGGEMARRVDICLRVDSDSTMRIQEGHLLIFHTLCYLVETSFLGGRVESGSVPSANSK